MKKIIILGSTGSIGKQTLEVIRKFPRGFEVVGLGGGANFKLLKQQIREFKPEYISTQVPQEFPKSKILPLEKLASQKCDLVVLAVSGFAGFLPVLSAIRAKNNLALANKESLVMGGEIVMREAKKFGVKIFPVDSEHSALAQLLEKVDVKKIKRVVITASGGSLRDYPLSKFLKVSPQKVLQHPTWQMGKKITLDCATMANKAFEVIEAHHLFQLPFSKIDVLIHPQSLVHAMVETIDGNFFAQLSNPSMHLPIQHALFEGERRESLVKPLDLIGKNLEFRKVEAKRYPLFDIILQAAKKGGLAPALAAVASELAGEKFLNKEIKFPEIGKLVNKVLELTPEISRGLTGVFDSEEISKLNERIKAKLK